jgi:hypothetical protein
MYFQDDEKLSYILMNKEINNENKGDERAKHFIEAVTESRCLL